MDDFRARVKGHRERLREKFLKYGLSSFTDEEVLELLLIFGTPRKDCKPLAREALKKFGSLAAVLEASPEDLLKIKGIGPKNMLAIKFVHGVARRFLERRLERKPYLSSAKEVYEYLAHSMMDLKKEIFKAIYLDARHQIIAVEDLFRGTVNESYVYPREVIERALSHHASAIVIAHNHPSGNPRPSHADIRLTKRLFMAAALLNLRLLDHLIVAKEGYFSFAEEGLLSTIEQEVTKAI
ncbi:RadC family protein [Thermodesulfatator atlanticus]|uniref:RadC family protein n=1 Tax=Thermodesulfatator atlanticus TaxID=501497 RepID=UPI0003B30767|nr:DNA repair protein RadC [Thermodesulfatator atlanticus]